jgi:HK97 family phage portal protein
MPWLREAIGMEPTESGIPVSGDSALRCTAVLACVRVLSESVAVLPLNLYRRSGDTTSLADEHPLYDVLHRRPNDLQTSYEFRALLMVWLCLHGNAYAEIVRDGKGQVTALWPCRPDRMLIRFEDGRLVYTYAQPGGDLFRLAPENVLHIRALSTGLAGISPIAAAKQSIGLSLAAEKFGATYFGSGARIGGVLEYPGTLNDESTRNIRDSFRRNYSGADKFHELMILEEGMKWNPQTIRNDEAQWLETRRFGVEDIARIFRVPPHMIGQLDNANYANVEAMDRAFISHGLTPWLTNMEQAYSLKLLSPSEQATLYVEHDLTRTLRGDHDARMKGYQAGIYSGIYSPNDCRRMENLNPRDGGDTYLQPTNMAPSPWSPTQGNLPKE